MSGEPQVARGTSGKVTAFVSHSDCARHDTGWGHPDHQGRLPALTRAVYADMLELFDPLLDAEGRWATDEELESFHTSEYVERARGWCERAAAAGELVEVAPGLIVSSATWDASLAAVGSAIVGTELVITGQVSNAFCATRPPGRDAGKEEPGRHGLLNPVAIAASMAIAAGARPLVIGWGVTPLAATFEGLPVVSLPSGVAAGLEAAVPVLADAARDHAIDLLVLSSGFDWWDPDDRAGRGELASVYDATRAVTEVADRVCAGRVVSILEGGYHAPTLGRSVVEHLRALAGVPL